VKSAVVLLLAFCIGIAGFAQRQEPSSPFLNSELLGRPTTNSVTVKAIPSRNLEIYFEYGPSPGVYISATDAKIISAGTPVEAVMDGLEPDLQYYYRMRYRESGTADFAAAGEHSFHTQRSRGSVFTFAIEADPHMDQNSDPDTFRLTLQNVLSEKPDFLIDLGDTFMSEKLARPNYQAVADRALLLRSYFDLIGHSVPLYLVIGNHEGEWGSRLTGTADNLPIWDTLIRKLYYPNPFPDGFYTGGGTEEKFIGQRESYYSWEWGDALFVVLDPYWYTPQSPELSGDWALTLGREQYGWLKATLENSRAIFKFVFCHNLVGGRNKNGTGPMRGGVEAARYLEWGGYNLDDTWGFDKARPGWAMPIHELLAANNVTVFFHGHDHFYGRQDLDGIAYQEVPQPSARNTNLGDRAASYGYIQGRLLGGTGYLRVNVSPAKIKVDYVQTWTPQNETNGRKNGQITDSYEVAARDRTKVDLVLNAGGAAETATAESETSLRAGYAVVKTASGSAPNGNAIFSLTQNGTVVSEAAVPASPATTNARIFVGYGTQVSSGPVALQTLPVDVYTGIAVVNPSAVRANITFKLRDRDARAIATGHGTLEAGTHWARFIHQLQDLAPDFILPPDFPLAVRFGSLEISSERALSIVALRMTVNQLGEPLFSSVPIADLTQAPSSSQLFFPHFADGDGYISTFILLNTLDRAQSGMLRFFGDDGALVSIRQAGGNAGSSFPYFIPAAGTYIFQTDGSSAAVRVGSLQLTPDSNSTAPGGAGIFSRTANGTLVAESGIPSAIPVSHARIYIDMAGGPDSYSHTKQYFNKLPTNDRNVR
jgi:hypothetical protein